MSKAAWIVALLAGLGWVPTGRAAEFALGGEASVVFLGDMVMEQGTFADAVEAFVRVAYPSNRARFFRYWQADSAPSSLQEVSLVATSVSGQSATSVSISARDTL